MENNMENLSPEEIEKAIAARAKAQTQGEAPQAEEPKQEEPVNLGKAVSYQGADQGNRVHIDELPANTVGWKPLPLENLPSGGMFYPDGATLEIRAASVREVRDFSTIDENDPISVEEKANKILSACCRFRLIGREAHWKDLKEEDRFYLLFAIREMTFIHGEGKLMVTVKCDGRNDSCDGTWFENVEINKDVFAYYSIEPKLMAKFDDAKKSFHIEHPKVGSFDLFVPSIGVLSVLKLHMREAIRDNRKTDQSYIQIAPFLFNDWRGMNANSIKMKEQDVAGWSIEKFSAVKSLTEMIRFGVKTTITRRCGQCGSEVAAPLSFPGGVRALFFVSDIVDEIL
jgi:hypothetical protein